MTRKIPGLVMVMTFTTWMLYLSAPANGEEDEVFHLPEGISLKLTKDFYEHLRHQGQNGDEAYSNDSSLDYLREISVSASFVVETNLQILRQQERIIRFLPDMRDKQK